ncbi:hypothetical protein GCM10010358_41710 [Streptomyces minutiscleroticus]|uniref:Uncharacterized protein n=1 Tax=Streptomyces minutiscleroticus TaxID=68238 RepID=A0A918NNH2_9ACTN|nr:hypothetical protein GCM10010358_41710 [Streptomyces minutiscleroticus]
MTPMPAFPVFAMASTLTATPRTAPAGEGRISPGRQDLPSEDRNRLSKAPAPASCEGPTETAPPRPRPGLCLHRTPARAPASGRDEDPAVGNGGVS